MRHIVVAATMLVVALVVTFGTASVLQGMAMAKGPASNEPFVIIEAAKPGPGKATRRLVELGAAKQRAGAEPGGVQALAHAAHAVSMIRATPAESRAQQLASASSCLRPAAVSR